MNYKLAFFFVLFIGVMLSLVSSGIVNPAGIGYAGRTYATNYEILYQSFNTPNVTVNAVIGGQNITLNPWYAQSNSCDASTPSQFNQNCNIGTENLTNFCMASDELSQYALTASMSQNVSNEYRIVGIINLIDALNVSSSNSLTEWKTSYQAAVGINKSEVTDSASDADARFIMALANIYNSNVFSSSTRTRAGVKLTEMCEDYSNYNFLKVSRISNANSSYTINSWPCGGTNVCTDLTNNDFMFSGYYGDNAMALGVCGVHTGNSTYFSMATDLVETYFAAANWTNNSVLRFPPGRSFKWNNAGAGQTPYATDTSGVPYIDTPDGKRLTSLCTAGYMFNLSSRTLHPRLNTYCGLIVNVRDGWGLTNYSQEWWPNGTIHSTAVDSFSNNGLAMQIDMFANQSNVQSRLDYIWSNKWDDTNKDFFTACQGIYEPSFVSHSMGYSLGYMEEAFGIGNTEIGNEAIGIVLREPSNGSVTYNTSELTDMLLRITVTNNNVSVITNTTYDTVPKVYSNCTFDSDSCGWTGPSQVSGGDGYLNLTSSAFSPSQNLTRFKNSSTFFVEQVYRTQVGRSIGVMKFYPMTEVGSFGSNDRFYLENSTSCGFVMKHEPSFEQVGTTIGCESNITVTIKLNVTGNIRAMQGNFSWTNGSASGSAQGNWKGFSSAQNTSYDNGVNGTGIEISGSFNGIPRLYNQHLFNIGVNASTTTSSLGNAFMNVTFINASDNRVIGTRNNVSSGSDVNITWGNLSLGVYRWYVNVSSENNRMSSFTVEFNVTSNVSSGGGTSGGTTGGTGGTGGGGDVSCSTNTGASVTIILVFSALAIVALVLILVVKFREGEFDIKLMIIVFIAVMVAIGLFMSIEQLTSEVCQG